MRSQLSIVGLIACAIDVLFSKLLPVPICSGPIPIFLIRFSIYDFMIHVDQNCVQGDRYVSIFIFYIPSSSQILLFFSCCISFIYSYLNHSLLFYSLLMTSSYFLSFILHLYYGTMKNPTMARDRVSFLQWDSH